MTTIAQALGALSFSAARRALIELLEWEGDRALSPYLVTLRATPDERVHQGEVLIDRFHCNLTEHVFLIGVNRGDFVYVVGGIFESGDRWTARVVGREVLPTRPRPEDFMHLSAPGTRLRD